MSYKAYYDLLDQLKTLVGSSVVVQSDTDWKPTFRRNGVLFDIMHDAYELRSNEQRLALFTSEDVLRIDGTAIILKDEAMYRHTRTEDDPCLYWIATEEERVGGGIEHKVYIVRAKSGPSASHRIRKALTNDPDVVEFNTKGWYEIPMASNDVVLWGIQPSERIESLFKWMPFKEKEGDCKE